MKVEDFPFQKDDGGFEFVTVAEGLTKTRGGGLGVKSRLATPKTSQLVRRDVLLLC